MYGFLLRPRWIAGHLLVGVGIVLFVVAGIWQLNRLSDRIARNELIEARAARPPTGLQDALNEVPAGADPGAELEFRTVLTTGTYAPDQELLVRSRSLNGQPGFHVVTPLLLADGAVLVNRGFVPQQLDDPPVRGAEAPVGQVEVEGRVRSSVIPPRIGPQDPPDGVLDHVFWLNVERISQQLPYDLAPVTIELVTQAPASAELLPVALPAPDLSEGPHRGYAIQWFSFAVIAAAGYVFLIRRATRRPHER